MKNKFQKILFASLCLNAAFIALFGAVAYRKRGAIKDAVAKVCCAGGQTNGAGGQTTESLALAMNQEVFEPVFGKLGNGEKTVKIAFVGNSLTLHGVANEIGWPRQSGMAASALENDYVHKLARKIAESKNVSVEYAVANVADFERDFDSFDSSRLKKIKDFGADFVVFQLGENLSAAADFARFEEKYRGLLNEFSPSVKIVCLPFWHDNNKNSAITKAALETNSFLVDLSHLDGILDARNYASSESDWKHKGVGRHPGDFGMENIAENIFSVLNAVIK